MDAAAAVQTIMHSKDNIKQGFKKLEVLNKLMKTVSKQTTDMATLVSRWEELDLTCDAFNDRVEDQMQHLRSQMDGRLSELQVDFIL